MKITDVQLTQIETEKGILPIQSNFFDLVYAIDKKNKAIWLVDRSTGAQIEIDAANVHGFAYELMDVADLFLPVQNLWKAGA